MISESVFLKAVDQLNTLFPDQKLSDGQAMIYFTTLRLEFTDDAFMDKLNFVIKNSFKMPPIAAFFKADAAGMPEAFDPVTADESANIRKVMERFTG